MSPSLTAALTALFVLQLTFLSIGGQNFNPNRFEPYNPKEYGIIQQSSLRNNSHNLVVGWRQYGDRLLARETVKKSYSFMSVVAEDFRYPPWGYLRNENITAISVVDQMAPGTGGFANITSGGVGLKTVNIHFKSQRNRSIKFLVEVFGK